MINTPKIYKMRIVFYLAPNAPAREDLVGALRSMILSSKLAYARSKQNPRVPRLAYGPSVKRGQGAQREYADIYLLTSVCAQQVRAQLEASKPQGLELLEVYRVPYAMASVQQLASHALYRAEGDFMAHAPKQTFENYVKSARLNVMCRAENAMCLCQDIKPYLVSAQTISATCVQFMLKRVGDKWISPLAVLYGWLGMEMPLDDQQAAACGFTTIREGLYWQDCENNLHLI